MDIPKGVKPVVVSDVPRDLTPEPVSISHIDSEFIGKIVQCEGIIRSITPIYPLLSRAYYQCLKCRYDSDDIIKICPVCHQKEIKYKEGEVKSIISIILEENIYVQDGSKLAVSIPCSFTEELQTKIDSLRLGQKVRVTGLVKLSRITKKNIFTIEAESYTPFEDNLSSRKITDKEKELFRSFIARPDWQDKLRKVIFRNDLYGLDVIQDAIILQMASSPKRYVGSILKNRGNLMILLVGSPGKGKSQVLKKAAAFFPNSRYVTGSGASGIGLTAAVSTDERIGQTVLTPGAIPLCHPEGTCSIDELDKISKDDLTKLNTQMDSLIIPIDKHNIHRILPADVSILSAMNPKYGTFDMAIPLWEQINLKKDFLDRFDLIFNVDYFVKKEDIVKLTKKNLEAYIPEEEIESHITPEFIVKFFAYCRTINPRVDYGVTDHIEREYYSLVNGHREEDGAYFSVRLQDTLIRLASASARLRLSETIDDVDVKEAIDLLKHAFISLGVYHPDSGLDSFKVEQLVKGKELKGWNQIAYQAERLGARTSLIEIEQIYSECGIGRSEFEQLLERAKKEGNWFEPKPGKLKLL